MIAHENEGNQLKKNSVISKYTFMEERQQIPKTTCHTHTFSGCYSRLVQGSASLQPRYQLLAHILTSLCKLHVQPFFWFIK